jgi:hypothetical protein
MLRQKSRNTWAPFAECLDTNRHDMDKTRGLLRHKSPAYLHNSWTTLAQIADKLGTSRELIKKD